MSPSASLPVSRMRARRDSSGELRRLARLTTGSGRGQQFASLLLAGGGLGGFVLSGAAGGAACLCCLLGVPVALLPEIRIQSKLAVRREGAVMQS